MSNPQFFNQEDEPELDAGVAETTNYRIFIKCRKCGIANCFDEIPPRRTDLALFRGSEYPVKCNGCHADMDTMLAFCGERIGLEIVRRHDPAS